MFRARHLNGITVQPGELFHFQLNLFVSDRQLFPWFEKVFAALAHEGLGPDRAAAELFQVDELSSPTLLPLDPKPQTPGSVEVEFLSPTELKHNGKTVQRPSFPVLFGRVRDRLATLAMLYADAPLDEIDFEGTSTRASLVEMTRCEIHQEERLRRSSRTGQTHPIGGFTGTARYEGDLAEFLPFLEAAQWTGVGRHAVWGNGEIRVR